MGKKYVVPVRLLAGAWVHWSSFYVPVEHPDGVVDVGAFVRFGGNKTATRQHEKELEDRREAHTVSGVRSLFAAGVSSDKVQPREYLARVHTKTMPAGHGRRRRLEPPLAPSVLAARNKDMKLRLSASSLVLGDIGPETRDWSLSSTQTPPTGAQAQDPDQRAKNIAMKKGMLHSPTT